VSDFQIVRGFEEAWRPPIRPHPRTTPALLSSLGRNGGTDVRSRLSRIVDRAPEVMVKVTGRTRDASHLAAHLAYIARHGALEAEDRDGNLLDGRVAIKELAEDWSAVALADSRRRANSPFSVSIVLSMPAGTDPFALCDAARAFAREAFDDRFDYIFVLHTDAEHPHVHLAVRALGDHGERLNPKKADLEAWRQSFAQALRERGVAAEATPRRARGITRKPERSALRKLRERHEAGHGEIGRVRRAAYGEAARAAFQGETIRMSWEHRLVERQAKVRALYLAQARLLSASPDPADRKLGASVDAFVRAMPAPDTQRLALARELRAANANLRTRSGAEPPRPETDGPGRDRDR
jgi:hypothetical protein